MNKPSPRPAERPSPRPRPTPRPSAQPAPAPRTHPLERYVLDAHDDEPRPERLHFGPDMRLALLAIPGAGFATLLAILGDDPAQRVVATLAVAVLLAIAISDIYFSPRLSVNDQGVRVRAPFDRARLTWDEIDSIKAATVSRYGLRSSTLEISAGERLIVLDKKDLAGDPWAVAAKIARFRFTK